MGNENENHSDIFGNAGISDMMVASIAMRELYLSFREAGFTEREACTIVAEFALHSGDQR